MSDDPLLERVLSLIGENRETKTDLEVKDTSEAILRENRGQVMVGRATKVEIRVNIQHFYNMIPSKERK